MWTLPFWGLVCIRQRKKLRNKLFQDSRGPAARGSMLFEVFQAVKCVLWSQTYRHWDGVVEQSQRTLNPQEKSPELLLVIRNYENSKSDAEAVTVLFYHVKTYSKTRSLDSGLCSPWEKTNFKVPSARLLVLCGWRKRDKLRKEVVWNHLLIWSLEVVNIYKYIDIHSLQFFYNQGLKEKETLTVKAAWTYEFSVVMFLKVTWCWCSCKIHYQYKDTIQR